MSSLQSSIERLASLGEVEHDPDARRVFLEFRDQLTQGKIRAAERVADQNNTRWTVNPWVKQGILLGFRLGVLQEMTAGLSFVDKDTFPARQLHHRRPRARRPRRIFGARRRLRCAIGHLHAAHVH